MSKAIDREKLLEWLRNMMHMKDKQIDRLKEEDGDDITALFEWGIYRKIIDDIENGKYDIESEAKA